MNRLLRIAYGPFGRETLAPGEVAEVARQRLRNELPRAYWDDQADAHHRR